MEWAADRGDEDCLKKLTSRGSGHGRGRLIVGLKKDTGKGAGEIYGGGRCGEELGRQGARDRITKT